MKMLDIYIDFKSPASYLAIDPLLDLLERTGVAANWRPYETREANVPERRADETVGERHRRVRAKSERDTHLRYAAVQKKEMQFRDQAGETKLALAALLHVQDNPLAFIHAAFHTYWVDKADLNSSCVVINLLAQNGYDADAFDASALVAQLETEQIAAEENGVVGAPAILIDSQLFIGRQHLPWIEALITGGG